MAHEDEIRDMSTDQLVSLVTRLQRDVTTLEIKCEMLLQNETKADCAIRIYAAMIANPSHNTLELDELRQLAIKEAGIFLPMVAALKVNT